MGSKANTQTGISSAHAIKVNLAGRIIVALDRQGLTVREAQARTGRAAADFSRLRSGQLDRFTIERLLGIAEALGEQLTLSVSADSNQRSPALPGPLAERARELRFLCRRFAVRRLGAFGSVLRQDFDPVRSDIDLAVEFGRSVRHGQAEQYFRFKESLERLLGRTVDLVELGAMPVSRLKRSIERSQVPVYEQSA